ncbi:MAG: hypothetical protein BRC54_10605 [Cyanobacteria bacterium SW_7_48_12]|nr:MAG: hypothetical protein BRC54_10605 [Cyanobacteria bacterium SW_7_48_12]
MPAITERCVVERTFGCLGRYRRLSKDDELLPEVSEAMIYGAMIRLMLHRVVSSGSLYKSALSNSYRSYKKLHIF